MVESSDQIEFLKIQYQNAVNLNARGNLHARFRTNPVSWFPWVFDHFDLPDKSRVLELGCGSGGLWLENLDRIPKSWRIVLSDFSPGMVQAAQQNLGGAGKEFEFKIFDAVSIPFPEESFDAVVANHMLYHVPDRKNCISEIYRILRPGGKFFAATNGRGHIKEIDELRLKWLPRLATDDNDKMNVGEFTLENGADQIHPPFQYVHLDLYKDSLQVTEVQPLLAYILSIDEIDELKRNAEEVNALKSFLENEITEKGSYLISKSVGLFVAVK